MVIRRQERSLEPDKANFGCYRSPKTNLGARQSQFWVLPVAKNDPWSPTKPILVLPVAKNNPWSLLKPILMVNGRQEQSLEPAKANIGGYRSPRTIHKNQHG
jgi:hypothetical protein